MNVNEAMKNFSDKYPGINRMEITTDSTVEHGCIETRIASTNLEWLRGLIGNKAYGYGCMLENGPLTIKKVIFNDPATIVFWSDGTKTVVKKQQPDSRKKFDKEKGLALAIAKKMAGNTGVYYNDFKKWCD